MNSPYLDRVAELVESILDIDYDMIVEVSYDDYGTVFIRYNKDDELGFESCDYEPTGNAYKDANKLAEMFYANY